MGETHRAKMYFLPWEFSIKNDKKRVEEEGNFHPKQSKILIRVCSENDFTLFIHSPTHVLVKMTLLCYTVLPTFLLSEECLDMSRHCTRSSFREAAQSDDVGARNRVGFLPNFTTALRLLRRDMTLARDA